jgi:hypothetical protein
MDDIIEMPIDDILLLVKKVIYNAVKSGEAKSGDYFLLDDDGVYIGDPESFDADVLFYAVKIDDVVDFSKEHPEDYISFDNIDISQLPLA